MKKNFAIGFLALVVCVGTFFAGHQIGVLKTEQQYHLRDSYLELMNAIATYTSQADIAQAIGSHKESKALCLVNLQASAQVNKVRACLENANCKEMIESEVQKMAPELLGQGELKIKYYKEGELCKP